MVAFAAGRKASCRCLAPWQGQLLRICYLLLQPFQSCFIDETHVVRFLRSFKEVFGHVRSQTFAYRILGLLTQYSVDVHRGIVGFSNTSHITAWQPTPKITRSANTDAVYIHWHQTKKTEYGFAAKICLFPALGYGNRVLVFFGKRILCRPVHAVSAFNKPADSHPSRQSFRCNAIPSSFRSRQNAVVLRRYAICQIELIHFKIVPKMPLLCQLQTNKFSK